MKRDKIKTHDLLNNLKPFLKLLFEEGNPSGIKAALSLKKICKNVLRLPLVPVSANLLIKIEKFISKNTY